MNKKAAGSSTRLTELGVTHLQHVELRLLDVPHVAGTVRDVGELEDFGWVDFLKVRTEGISRSLP